MSPRPVIIGTPDPVFRTLRSRRAWVIALIGAALGGAVGAAVLFATPKTFKATVAVELSSAAPQVNISGVGPRADPVTIDTDAQIVVSDEVVDAVVRLGNRTPTEVREHLKVSARPLTQVMTLTYAAGSAEAARNGAAVAADTFLDERRRLIVAPVRAYLTAVSEKPVSNSATTGDGVTTEAKENLWSLELRRQAALTRELGLQGAGSVIEQARITAAGDRGDLEVPVATGLAVGALLGVVVAVLWDIRRRRRSVPGLDTMGS